MSAMTKRTLGLTLIAAALAGVPTGASAPSPARDAGPTDPHRR